MKVNHALCLVLLVCAVSLTVPPASATTRVVTSLGDNGPGTLRDTIAASAANDTIVFALNGSITITNGELQIGRDLTITGPGATNLSIDAQLNSRVFDISAGTVSISGLSINEGAVIGSDGVASGGSSSGSDGIGGGILNYGALTLSNCILLDNLAYGGRGAQFGTPQSGNGGDAHGGGIANFGTLAVSACTIFGSDAIGGNGGDATNDTLTGIGGKGFGGGIANFLGASAFLTNCTLWGNGAGGGDAGLPSGTAGVGDGGAIWSDGTNLLMVNCTVNQNSAGGGSSNSNKVSGGTALGGGVSGPFTSLNTIIAGNFAFGGSGQSSGYAFGPDVIVDAGDLVLSLGHNLIGETNNSYGWVSSDLTGSIASPLDPQLGPLQINGGQTLTLALLPTSPAIDTGDDAVLSSPFNLTTDQRGAHRPGGKHVDIGAYEFGGNTLLVTTFADSGLGSLRQAIASASPGDRVMFTPLIVGTIALTGGELLIDQPLNIVGPGATNLTISGNQSSRVFHVNPSGSLNMFGLTLANGVFEGELGADAFGGGLFDEGNVSLMDCVITNCSVTGGVGETISGLAGKPGGNGAGGGAYNSGLLSLLRCTITGNSAQGGLGGAGSPGGKGSSNGRDGGAGGGAFGGGLANAGILELTNCTVAENTAHGGTGGVGGTPSGTGGFGGAGGPGGSAHGTGLSIDTGNAILTSCTVSGNLSIAGSGGGGGGSHGSGGSLGPGGSNSGGLFSDGQCSIQNCIVALNQATNDPDVNGSVQSGGFNLVGISDGSVGWLVAEAGNLGNGSFPINPLLGPLQNNGGATPTMALLAGSPAIDQGDSFGLTTDQRGFARPSDNGSVANASGGDGSDIGAYELNIVMPATLAVVGNGSNQFQLQLTGLQGWNYVIQATTDLSGANWLPLVTNVSPFTFVVTNANNFASRFFRGVSW